MRHLYTRSPDIPGPPGSLLRSSLQDLLTRPLSKIPMQDFYTRPPGISRPLGKTSNRGLHRGSLQDLFTKPLREIFIQALDILSLPTGSLFKISSQYLCHRSLCKISIRDLLISLDLLEPLYRRFPISLDLLDLLTVAPSKISSQDLYGRSLYKISCYLWTSLQDLYDRSLYRSSLQDLFTRPL